ncbi:GNAT family N-acetyltransferase [Ensifer sp. T173]|jgi:RimJ/RimL family protein N-acetyltransferase|uniref:GNAT family N-acetyltransferase n=1 Tax=Ensifer canadensis TaxID=555315 RepID=A0AAW4FMC3_9HYPH|nr:GNAT family N-acetyltransferase [Ensifer canadensis]MBM3091840.1 GNAT family N-acetyltransferase [Ensifer canadensis]NOV19690.1 N-acetyltransferase [Ensifer canadensis]UBI77935.1 GNAT family N-acetyltransferase [Ensifer canadensis]
MIILLTPGDFEALAEGVAPSGLRLVEDSVIAPQEVLRMLSDLNRAIAADFSPSAWMIVANEEIVGLCSVIRPPGNGELHIGYGVAPSREGRGIATAAVGDLLDWARSDRRVRRISAETAVDNVASQRVLERNGFAQAGQRTDPEDGPLICWEIATLQ